LLFKPDKTKNYELGVKGDWPGHALSFEASVYYIDWKDIQVAYALPPSYFSYFANGSRAKSEGVELDVESRPLSGLTLSAWFAWNEAVLTQDLPPGSLAVAYAGDRLPYSSRFSGSVSAEENFVLAAKVTGFVGGSLSYFSDRRGEFGNIFSANRQAYPGYARTDLRAGVKYDTWSASLYINNVADKRAALSGGIGNYNPAVFRYLQPRTIGISLARQF
jgi:outer membrane receptor protein involved in Fe transport